MPGALEELVAYSNKSLTLFQTVIARRLLDGAAVTTQMRRQICDMSQFDFHFT